MNPFQKYDILFSLKSFPFSNAFSMSKCGKKDDLEGTNLGKLLVVFRFRNGKILEFDGII